MGLNWRKESPYYAAADEREDGSHYGMLKLQEGRCYYAWWRWPLEKRFKTDGRVHELDHLYDGSDKHAAVVACNEHYQKRMSNERLPS